MKKHTTSKIILKAHTGMPSANESYLANTTLMPQPEPLSDGTVGFLMILSTLQYQAPYVNPAYSNAVGQAGKAAYMQSGGQAMQDKATSKVENKAKEVIRDVGVTDTQLGVVLGGAKIIRDKQIDVNGPRFHSVATHVTMATDHGALGFRINF